MFPSSGAAASESNPYAGTGIVSSHDASSETPTAQAVTLPIAAGLCISLGDVLTLFDSLDKKGKQIVAPKSDESSARGKDEEEEEEEEGDTESSMAKKTSISLNAACIIDEVIDDIVKMERQMNIFKNKMKRLRERAQTLGITKSTQTSRGSKNNGSGRLATRCQPCSVRQNKCEGGQPGKRACTFCSKILARDDANSSEHRCYWTTQTAQNYNKSEAGKRAARVDVEGFPSFIQQ